jgi:hypothetical protein
MRHRKSGTFRILSSPSVGADLEAPIFLDAPVMSKLQAREDTTLGKAKMGFKHEFKRCQPWFLALEPIFALLHKQWATNPASASQGQTGGWVRRARSVENVVWFAEQC